MPSTATLAGALLLAGVAAANPFTTLDVCPGADPTVTACTVTAQHQTISTCSPVSTTCSTQPTITPGHYSTSGKNATISFKSCSTAYSYSSWAWVSTVIPCGWDGKSMSSCTVTKTQQDVPCSVSVTTSTSSTPTHTGYSTYTYTGTVKPYTTSTSVKTIIDYSTSYQTISKVWNAPYNKLGPHAIPGYPGNELAGDGDDQSYDVTQCESWNGKAPTCQQYPENHPYPKSAPASSTPVTATNSIKTSVPSAGHYTFTFTNSAPSQVITSGGQAYTQPPHPWFQYETRTADGPTDFDFTVTVTRTISVWWPGTTSAGQPAPIAPSAAGWGNWNAPSTPTGSSDPSGSSGPQGWGNWNNGGSSDGSNGGNGGSSDGSNGGNGGFNGFPGAPGSGTFYIPVDSSSGSKYSKGGDQWVGFPNGGDDGAVVSGKGNAAQFYWDSDGNLMCNGQYVSTSTGAGYLVFELGPNKPSGPKFSVGPDGSFGLPGAGFCATDNTFFITFGGSPNGCKPVSCPINGDGSNTISSGPSAPTFAQGWGNWPSSASSGWVTKTTSNGAWPTGDNFALKIILSGKDGSYVGFSGDSAILTDSSNYASFSYSSGSIYIAGSGNKFGASSSSGSGQLKSYGGSGNGLSSSWGLSGGSVSYPGAGFCIAGSSVKIYFGNAPSGCLSCNLNVDHNPDDKPSPTADPSGDWSNWDNDAPKETGSAWKRGSGLRNRMANY